MRIFFDLSRRPAWLALAALAFASLGFGADAPVAPVAAAPRPAPASTAPSYAKFQYISDWNIFDSTRVGRRSNEPAVPPVQTISLVGTIQYEKGLFALFDSADRDNQKAAKEGELIADFTIQQITPLGVDLVRGGKHVSLTIGQQLTKRVGGGWEASGLSGAAVPGATITTPADPAGSSEILKRLMEKRQQQLKQ